MKLGRGTSSLWSLLYSMGLARAAMPFWRVVVEARLVRGPRRLLKRYEAAVTAVFVWARTIEEAEGLAALALEAEGLSALTADAGRCKPGARPSRAPAAVARGPLRYLPRVEAEPQPGQRPRRARA